MRIPFYILFAASAVYTMVGHARINSELRIAMVAVGLTCMTVAYPRLGLPGRAAVGWLSCILGALVLVVGFFQVTTDIGFQITGSGLALLGSGLAVALWPKDAAEPSLLDWAGSDAE